MLSKGLGYGLNGLLFLLPALVLVVDRSLGAVAVLLLVLSAIMLLRERQLRVPLDRDAWVFIAAFGAYPAAVLLNLAVHEGSRWSDFDIASRFLLVLPIFFAVRRYGCSRELLYLGLIIGAIGAGCFGYYQKYVQGLPVAHGFIHKISFGNISLMMGVLALTYCIRPRQGAEFNRWLVAGAVVAFGFGLLGSVTSGTRGGWIAAPLMLWVIVHEAIERKRWRYGIYAGFVAACLMLYQNNTLVQHKVDKAVVDAQAYFSDTKQVSGSAGTRFEMWRAAGLMFKDSPVFGIGEGNYRERLQAMMDSGEVDSPFAHGHAHNEFFNALAELGLVGGVGLLLLYGLLVRFFFRHRQVNRRLSVAGLLLCFGYIDFGLTQVMLSHNITVLFFVTLAVMLAGLLQNDRLHGFCVEPVAATATVTSAAVRGTAPSTC